MTIKIGWASSSKDWQHPADRRRLGWFLSKLKAKISIEFPKENQPYDILYLTIASDLSRWAQLIKSYKQKNTWIIFDLCDFDPTHKQFFNILKSFYNYYSGRYKYLCSYNSVLLQIIQQSHVVVCGSREQKKYLEKENTNVAIIRDAFFPEFPMTTNITHTPLLKKTYHILWEGMSHGNHAIFKKLSKILIFTLEQNPAVKFVVHFATDLTVCRISNKYLCQETKSYLDKLFKHKNMKIYTYPWTTKNIELLASKCQLGLIPIPNKPILMNKPENKLLLYWYLGIPTICSQTPSYSRLMSATSLSDYCCQSNQDWCLKIIQLLSSPSATSTYKKKTFTYLKKYYNEDHVLASWHHVFQGSRLQCDNILNQTK